MRMDLPTFTGGCFCGTSGKTALYKDAHHEVTPMWQALDEGISDEGSY
jgi:hypothetical protein